MDDFNKDIITKNNNNSNKRREKSTDSVRKSSPFFFISLPNFESPEINCFCSCSFNNNDYIKNANLMIDEYIFHIAFDSKTTNIPFNHDFFTFSLLNIKSFELKKNKIDIKTKDYRKFSFKLANKDYNNLNDILNNYSKPSFTKDYKNYALWYKTRFKPGTINGWDLYKIEEEIKLQELNLKKYTLFNNNYKICESYPKNIIIPSNFSREDIIKCAKYRAKRRFPILTYYYKKNDCSIWRSSQTMSNFGFSDNEKEIELLTKIAGIKKLIIYDARPKINALANVLKGAGYENINNYPNISMEIKYCDMSNIHSVRNSLKQFYKNVIYNRELKPNDNSQWIESIIIMIKSAEKIYNSIKNDNNVLIHCSDGWDRTTQLCSLAQIFLDKRFRTINGFINLIEKDWFSFGHLFSFRYGYYNENDIDKKFSKENQRSPIFIQFLDAVYQIVSQNNEKFEFNVNLLKFLAEEVNNGKYGNFLFNNDFERDIFNDKENTVSIWSEIKKNESMYKNHIYKDSNSPIEINYKRINVWYDYFYRFEKNKQENIYMNNVKFKKMENEISSLKKKIEFNEKKLNSKNNKINDFENKIQLKNKIIKEFADLINNSKLDISKLSKEAQNILKENDKSDSYVVINNKESKDSIVDLIKQGYITKNKDDPLSQNRKIKENFEIINNYFD